MNAFRQTLRFQIKANHILPGVCEVTEASFETEDEEHARVVSERDAGVAPLYPVQSRAAEHGALGHQFGGDAAPPAGVAEVGAQFAEHGQGGEGSRRVAV